MNWLVFVYRFSTVWREAIHKMLKRLFVAAAVAAVAGVWLGSNSARAEDALRYKPMPGFVPAPASVFGLYKGSDYRLTTGACKDCQTPQQALWYFRDDIIAVPADGVDTAGFARGITAQEDVRRWYAGATPQDIQARPPMLWIGATHQARDVRLLDDNRLQFTDGRSVQFQTTPKIKTNLSYYDDSSKVFFQKRLLRVRGELRGQTFTARVMWPQDWAIDEKKMKLEPLLADESLLSLVRRHPNAKSETFETRLLWERTPAAATAARDWSGRAVIGIMLNGAQGDDDEAHGGHFAIATGRHTRSGHGSRMDAMDAMGGMADWMVNNFYNLGSFSEKGITAAMLPMDNYMADLNSGQSWYRPSYMLVAVLKNDRAAYTYQAAISRVYGHFYRQDFHYRHAGANCAGISLDTLRSLGWNIPQMGPTSALKATLAYPYKSITERSFASGKQAYDYLMEEQTRLYPAAAFDALGRELLRITRSGASAGASGDPRALETLLREDLEALVFVRMPQLPSSRAFGSFPVTTFDEYMKRVPEDKAQWKIVPVDARPFPPALIEADTLKEARVPPEQPAMIAGAGLAGLLLFGGLRVRSKRKRRQAQVDTSNENKSV
jgi:hypothetical protein